MPGYNIPYGRKNRLSDPSGGAFDLPVPLDQEALELIERARQGLSWTLNEEES